MRHRLLPSVGGIFFLALAPRCVYAQVPPALFNTGVAANGTVLADGALDPHYALIASSDPAHAGPSAFVVNATGYPIGSQWMADSATSKWIGAQANQNDQGGQGPGGDKPGAYTYRTTFTLSGINPAGLQISGAWSADDFGTDILVNGQSTGLTAYGPGGVGDAAYTRFVPFTISRFFVSGLNTLDFVVTNGSPPGGERYNPAGFRVDQLRATVTPEPGSVALLVALGATGAGFLAHRRRLRSQN